MQQDEGTNHNSNNTILEFFFSAKTVTVKGKPHKNAQ